MHSSPLAYTHDTNGLIELERGVSWGVGELGTLALIMIFTSYVHVSAFSKVAYQNWLTKQLYILSTVSI